MESLLFKFFTYEFVVFDFVIQLLGEHYIMPLCVGECGKRERGCSRHAALSAIRLCLRSIRNAFSYIFTRSYLSCKSPYPLCILFNSVTEEYLVMTSKLAHVYV